MYQEEYKQLDGSRPGRRRSDAGVTKIEEM